jgi:DNA replication protein DnaC
MIPSRKLNFLKAKIKKECQTCFGEGCSSCQKKTSRLMKYASSGIPIDYWLLSFKNFEGDPNFGKIIKIELSNIDKMYEEGGSLAFVGNLGTGKTYAACCLLKMAIVSGYSAKYINMADVIEESIRGNSAFFDEITNTDYICIDEFDSRWVYPSEKAEQLFGQTMERILRQRFQNKMPTIICSNTPELKNVLAGDFSRAVDSLFSKYVRVLYVSGKDFRKIQKQKMAL